jgi:hypothetical protein
VSARTDGALHVPPHTPPDKQNPLLHTGSPEEDIVTVSAYAPGTKSRTVDGDVAPVGEGLPPHPRRVSGMTSVASGGSRIEHLLSDGYGPIPVRR